MPTSRAAKNLHPRMKQKKVKSGARGKTMKKGHWKGKMY